MGGVGSGSWQQAKTVLAERSASVSIWDPWSFVVVEQLGPAGSALVCLEHGLFGQVLWSIKARAGDAPAPQSQRVDLVASPGTAGGLRWWFACPDCSRRCAKLYRPRSRARYSCRLCARVSYTSQREDDHDRLYRRAAKLYDRVSVRTEWGARRRRRGVHQRTFDRTMAMAYDFDAASLRVGLTHALALATRVEQRHASRHQGE